MILLLKPNKREEDQTKKNRKKDYYWFSNFHFDILNTTSKTATPF